MLFINKHLRDRICTWLLPFLVVTFTIGWLQTFPLTKEIEVLDFWAELLLCLIGCIGYFFVVRTRINTLVVGWSFITLHLYIDFLDELTEQTRLDSYIQMTSEAIGFLTFTVGLYASQKILRKELSRAHTAEAKLTQSHAELEEAKEKAEGASLELQASNRELNAFAYSVSHDLRAPVRAMDGFSAALLQDHGEKLNEEGKDMLRRVRKASGHLAALIDAMLTLSRLTRREMRVERVNLGTLARSVTDSLRAAEPQRQASILLPAELEARGDRELLRVVLENLLGNAWKFSSEQPQAQIEFGVTQADGERAYFVRDDGAGFDMAYADKLFGPFQRLHRQEEFPGHGIGLATVERIVHGCAT